MERRTIIHAFGRVALLAAGLASRASATQAGGEVRRADASKVACSVTALTICAKGYCTYLGDGGGRGELFVFDFGSRTYVNRSLGSDARPMQQVSGGPAPHPHYEFVAEMPHGTANVVFNATSPAFGPVKRTAAAVFAADPADATAFTIDGMTCEPRS